MALTDGLQTLLRTHSSATLTEAAGESTNLTDKIENPDSTVAATTYYLTTSDKSGSGWGARQLRASTSASNKFCNITEAGNLGASGEYSILVACEAETSINSNASFIGLQDGTGPTVSLSRNGTEGRLTINHNAGNYGHTTSGFNWDTGAPQIFVATYDGSTCRFYINGAQAGSNGALATTPRTSYTGIRAFMYYFDDAPESFKGTFYAIGVWNRALSGAEIADLADLADCLALEALADGGGASAVPLLMMHYN